MPRGAISTARRRAVLAPTGLTCAVLASALLSLLAALPVHAQEIDRAGLARQVRQELAFSWNAYKRYAWGHDELLPLSRGYRDWYGVPFAMTAVDSLDTLIIMGLQAEADTTREYIATHLSFNQDVFVSVFEFTIRLMGGLLSSYQLTGDARLLHLAQDLADREMPAFKSPTGMPFGDVNLATGAVRRPVTNPAEIGTLLLEFGALSKLTGNPAYYAAARKASQEVYKRRSPLGLVGGGIDVRTGRWTDSTSHVGGAIDSYYEYQLKGSLLFHDPDLGSMWTQGIQAANRYASQVVGGNLWYGRVDMNTGTRQSTVFGALEAFLPAELALSGDLPRAKQLLESCVVMWKRYGVEPDQLDYVTMTAVAPAYHLNPEIFESAYYLYHYTQDPHYQVIAKELFDSLRALCRTDNGYTELSSVVTRQKADLMPSYFLAETLKYLYLLFAPAQSLDFSKVIFTTEAHPLRETW
jgi:ER degradation enhancer, mannosidase alpha-like 2